MSLFAALLFAGMIYACDVPAFCEKYESVQVDYSPGTSYGSCGYVRINEEIIYVRENPYANSNMCAPDMNWATCFKYCFSYNGKTYFFNPC